MNKEYHIVLHTDGNRYANKGSTNYTYDLFAENGDEARSNAIDLWEQVYGSLTEKERNEMFMRATYGVKK